jgi:hypothetical protein
MWTKVETYTFNRVNIPRLLLNTVVAKYYDNRDAGG